MIMAGHLRRMLFLKYNERNTGTNIYYGATLLLSASEAVLFALNFKKID